MQDTSWEDGLAVGEGEGEGSEEEYLCPGDQVTPEPEHALHHWTSHPQPGGVGRGGGRLGDAAEATLIRLNSTLTFFTCWLAHTRACVYGATPSFPSAR